MIKFGRNLVKRVLDTKYKSYLVDLFFILFILISVYIDINVQGFPSKPILNIKFNESTLILTELLPLTITIVSIVVSLTKEEFYGLTLNELNKITRPSFFNLLHFFIISVVAFVANYIFIYFELKLATTVLQIICIIYCIIFGYQQLSLFINNKRMIISIFEYQLKRRYKGTFINAEENTNRNIGDKFINNVIFDVGAEAIYNSYKKRTKFLFIKSKRNGNKNFRFIRMLLNYLVQYFNDVDLNENTLSENEIMDIKKKIVKGYENLIWLFSDQTKEITKEINNDYCFSLVALTIRLQKLSVKLKIDDKKYIEYLFANIQGFYNKRKNLNVKIYLQILLTLSLRNKDITYIEAYKKSLGHLSFSYEDSYPSTLLISFIMVFILNTLDKKEESGVYKFMNEQYTTVEFDPSRSWNERLEFIFESIDPKNLYKILNEMILIYEHSNAIGYLFDDAELYAINGHNFTIETIFDYWFEIVSLKNDDDIEENFKLIFEMDQDNKLLILNLINRKFVNLEEYEFKFTFLKTITTKNNLINNENIKLARVYANLFYRFSGDELRNCKEKTKEKVEDIDFEKEKEKIFNLFNQQITTTTFYRNVNLPDNKNTATLQTFIFRTFNTHHLDKELDNEYKSKWANILLNLIKTKILQCISNNEIETIYDKNKNYYTDDTIAKLKENYIKFVTSIWKFQQRLPDLQQIKDLKFTSMDFACADNGIIINATVNKEKSFLRRMDKQKIDDYIDKVYIRLDNGFYRYFEEDGVSYLVTKEKLKELIENKLYEFYVVIDIKLEVDSKNCFVIKQNSDEKYKTGEME